MAQGPAKKIGSDHGGLSGLADDDHTQYLNDTRHTTAHARMRAERITSNQTISHASETTLIYNSVVNSNDPSGDFTLNTSTGVVTFNNGGTYLIVAGARWASGTNTNTRMDYTARLNGGAGGGIGQFSDTTGGYSGVFSTSFTFMYTFTATDTVQVMVRQDDSGGASRAVLANSNTFMSIVKMSE